MIGVCVGIARDCEKTRRETRPERARSRTTWSPRQQSKMKRQAQRSQSQPQYLDVQLTMCPECEATILAETTVCPHCDSPQPVCMVCNCSIVPLDSTLSCPHCRGRAHRIHFLEYLKVKGVCPRCKTDLDPHELVDGSKIELTPTLRSGPKHICLVCDRTITSTDSVLQCPQCEGLAHRIHFLEYIKVKGVCPICRVQLDSHDLVEFE